MSIKPFKLDAQSVVEKNNIDTKETIKPFKIPSEQQPDTGIEITQTPEFHQQRNRSTFASIAQFLSSFSAVLLAFVLFVFSMLLAHLLDVCHQIFLSESLSDYIYLSGLLLFVTLFALNIFSNIRQLLRLKSAHKLKEKFQQQSLNADQEIVNLSHQLFKQYSEQGDPTLIAVIESIKYNMNQSLIYQDLYQQLDKQLLGRIDQQAEKLVKNASLQTALSTAVSPVPIIDMFFIIWRSFLLTKDIAVLYGYKPGALTRIILLKQGITHVVFAASADIISEMGSETMSTALFSKVSFSVGMGLANGILLARLGYGVIEACRPMSLSENRDSFVKSVGSLLMAQLYIKKEPSANKEPSAHKKPSAKKEPSVKKVHSA